MKKLLMTLLSLILMHPAYAESAKLRMKIAGPVQNNKYFLCVTNAGCINMNAGKHGKIVPIGNGTINNIFTLDRSSLRMYPQALPHSCQVSVAEGQTMTVIGKLIQGTKGRVAIQNLRCAIS